MIKKEEVFVSGKVLRTHGIKGEIVCSFNTDAFEDCEFFILELDNILVPFYIDSIRPKSDSSCIVLVDGIDSDEKARQFIGLDIYLPNEMKGSAGFLSYEFFIGYDIYDINENRIGKIVDINTQTKNALFFIDVNGEEVIIPIAEEFIVNIDQDKSIIIMNLPEGLLELNN